MEKPGCLFPKDGSDNSGPVCILVNTFIQSFDAMRLVLAGFLVSLSLCSRAQSRLPYRDSTLPVSERVQDLLARMTPEEKFWQLFMIPGEVSPAQEDQYRNGLFGFQVSAQAAAPGANQQLLQCINVENATSLATRINAMQHYFVSKTRLGIPIIPFDEGLHGLVRQGCTVFPQAIALAASWDTALMRQVAGAIARETRQRGIRQILSPVINIASDVRWGRTEETYGEDPFLCSRMAVTFVSELEKNGIISTPKHFIANVGDGGRDSYPIHFNERLLREIYLPPFQACFEEGGASSVMTSYNSLDGSPATANDWLLNQLLKKEWGFKGFVISDASAVGGANVLHFTARDYAEAGQRAITNGLDVIFQTAWEHAQLFKTPFLDGRIAPQRINDAVSRVLTAKFELGLFENPYTPVAKVPDSVQQMAHKKLAAKAALESIVLLKNRNDLLPLKPECKQIALIGADATEGRLGGYSGPGTQVVSILQGIRTRAGKQVQVLFEPGCGRGESEWIPVSGNYLFADKACTTKGLRAEYFNNTHLSGEPLTRKTDPSINFRWTLFGPVAGLNNQFYSCRWTGFFRAPVSGQVQFGLSGDGGYRLYIDDRLIVDRWAKLGFETVTVPIKLQQEKAYAIRIEYYQTTGNATLRLVSGLDRQNDWKAGIDRAVRLARRSAVAIVVAGLEEGEFRDRASLALPGHQEELIRAVKATGKPTIVVLVGGSAVTMDNWSEQADGILDIWYPGEEGGTALASILFGDESPSGKLPITFPVAETQLPLVYNHKPTGRGDDYVNLTGLPLFPFGFGLSYTRFEYSDIRFSRQKAGMNDTVEIYCKLKNTGNRAGEEVAQLYLHDELASLARPVMELKGFQRIRLAPGEEKEIRFVLPPTAFGMFNESMKWVVEPGQFRIMIGSSSREIRLTEILSLD